MLHTLTTGIEGIEGSPPADSDFWNACRGSKVKEHISGRLSSTIEHFHWNVNARIVNVCGSSIKWNSLPSSISVIFTPYSFRRTYYQFMKTNLKAQLITL